MLNRNKTEHTHSMSIIIIYIAYNIELSYSKLFDTGLKYLFFLVKPV